MPILAQVEECFKRDIQKIVYEDEKIYINGVDNNYPTKIELVVNASPTAKMAVKTFTKYLAGKGLTNAEQDVIVNQKKQYYLSEIIQKIANSYAYQGGAFIHVSYGLENGNIVPKNLDVLDYKKCRVAKEDDSGYPGKIIFSDFTKEFNLFSEEELELRTFYPFNKNQEVLIEQVKYDWKLKNPKSDLDKFSLIEALPLYRGQVFFFNPSDSIYPLAPIDPAGNDADTESRISIYSNVQSRAGFLGKLMLVMKGLTEEDLTQTRKEIKTFIGAENSGGAYLLEVDAQTDLTEALRIEQLKPQIDDSLFIETNDRIQKNILSCLNNLPKGLVLSNEGLFSNSGEAYQQMKLFYNEQTYSERKEIERALKKIGFNIEIEPLIKEESSTHE